MINLSHWNIKKTFGVVEVAALIMGIDPTDIGNNGRIFMPALNLITEHFGLALNNYPNLPPEALASVAMEKNNTLDKNALNINEQKFSRKELARWLSALDVDSVYSFDLKQQNTIQKPTGHWPWGSHHTELLGHLEAAAREFWAGYDPQNPKATAPKNETVVAWLEARKVSNQMAKSIATMLRPDDLPTGPRK